MTKTTRKPIRKVVVKWGGDADGYDVYARAVLPNGTHIDGRVLYNPASEKGRTRDTVLGSLRKELKAAGYSVADIGVAFTKTEDEEVL